MAFWRLAALLAVVLMLSVVAGLGLLLPTRFDLSFPEGAVVSGMKEVAEGRTPYTDWRHWPHRFAPYGPLTYYLPGWLADAVLQRPDTYDYYRFGRVHSFVFLIGIWTVVVGLGRRVGLSWSGALVPLGLFLVWRWVQEFALSFRPDAPQVFFGLLALWIGLGGRARGWRLFFAMAALMASYWYKPTSWGIAVALGLWTSWEQGALRAVGLWLGFLVAGLVGALALDVYLGGALMLNMLGVTVVGWQPLRMLTDLSVFPMAPLALLLLATVISALLLTGLARGSDSEVESASMRRERLLALALVFSFGFAFIQYGKAGADRNYFLESYALGCVLVVWGFHRWMAQPGGNGEKIALAIALLLGLGIEAGQGVKGLKAEVERARVMSRPLPGISEFREEGLLVLAYHPYLSLTLGSEPSLLDGYQYMCLIRENPQLEQSVLRRVRKRTFDLILIPGNANYLYSREFFPMLLKHYAARGRLGPNVAYEPKPSGDTSQLLDLAEAQPR